jgi:hypothetical protein
MRAAVDRIEQMAGPVLVKGTGVMRTLLDMRDLARTEQEWLREANDGSELALQYRLLMASVEIHASGAIAPWPDDPVDNPAAAKLGEITHILFKDFREILDKDRPRREN